MRHPWFPFWPRDYLADTQHLSTAEHGAYCLLIMSYWTNGGLPNDDDELARITRQSVKAWRAMRPVIARFFEDGWRHKRIEADLIKMATATARRRLAGSIGGTRASINRQIAQSRDRDRSSNAGSNASSNAGSKRVANEQQNGSNAVATNNPITNNLSVAARARGTENPEKSTAEIADEPAGFAEKAREAVRKTTDIASGELASTIAAKGWAK